MYLYTRCVFVVINFKKFERKKKETHVKMVRHPGNPAREFQLMRELLCNRKSCFCMCVVGRYIPRRCSFWGQQKQICCCLAELLIITLDDGCCCYAPAGTYTEGRVYVISCGWFAAGPKSGRRVITGGGGGGGGSSRREMWRITTDMLRYPTRIYCRP